MPRPRRNSLPAPFSPILSLPSNIGPSALSDFSTESADWMDGTNGFTASAKFEACKAYGYEHPIARTPTEDMDSGVFSKGKSRLMVAVGIPSEHIVRVPRTSGGLAGISQAASNSEDKECMKEVIDLEDQSQGTRSPSIEQIRVPTRPTEPTTQPPPQHQPPIPTPSVSYSNPVNPPGHHPEIEVGPSSLYRLSPGLGLVPQTFDHPSEDVLEFENDNERARRLLVNTRRLLEAHVGKMVKGASNHRYSEFVQRGQDMDGLLTHAITQLSDWYETLEVENHEGFEWDDLQGKRKAEYSP
ncbi:hypothetical protein PPACK8108_LOCUS2635 [Phakopsora pachyrhizi]|uniref:Uncharacterized protein n=1 Tax=Phakopsora pachyrhizi TaxID=170000 RepID=A0AAV0AK31_PHAPC|nr:hypothetical protein PPACK8108_LOCUS2635 [Phakopsora pachyrhizi]